MAEDIPDFFGVFVQATGAGSASSSPIGGNFCIKCCNNLRSEFYFHETWNFDCNLGPEITRDQYDLYDYEFRFARRRTLSDSTSVSCELPRTTEVNRTTTLAGYKLTVGVYESSQSIDYWRSVISCEAEPIEIEGRVEVETFKQVIILEQQSFNGAARLGAPGVAVLGAVAAAAALLLAAL